MNRTDRLLAILLELQAKRWQRAEDLAATFEISKRTIYRDMLALMEAGVPVVSSPGQGYSLAEGYFLPPLSFGADEAVTLLLGADYMARNFDAQYRAAAETAMRKIEVALTDKLRMNVVALRSNFHFIVPESAVSSAQLERLAQVRRAVIESKTLHFQYHARSGASEAGTQTQREADPYQLGYNGRTWFVVAYCHLRQDIRHFRLDRMDNLHVTQRTFTRSDDVDIRQDESESRALTVRVLFNLEMSRWIREDRSFYIVGEEERPDGLLVTLQVRHENEILRWLLGWGAHGRVLEPESLRERLAEEAQRLLELYVPEIS